LSLCSANVHLGLGIQVDNTAMSWYHPLAKEAMDRVFEFGQCNVLELADVELFRAAVGKEARRRQVRVLTRGFQDSNYVVIGALEPSVVARAYTVATLRAAMETAHNPDAEPVVWKWAMWLRAGEVPANS
jgi:hypothetical protein